MKLFILLSLGLIFLSSNAFARDFSIKLDQTNFKVAGPIKGETVEVETRIPYTVYETVVDYRTITIPEYDMVCSGGNSKAGRGGGDWHGYYNVRGVDGKAKALKKAILGVGDARSEFLAKGGYFMPKPRSWRAFVKVLKQAERNGLRGLVADVTGERYGDRNMIRLGYDYSRQDPTCRRELVGYQLVAERYERETAVRSSTFQIRARFKGLILQESEAQTVNLSIGALDELGERRWNVAGSSLNRLRLENQVRKIIDSGDDYTRDTEVYLLDISANRILRQPKIQELSISFDKHSSNKLKLMIDDLAIGRGDDLVGPGVVTVRIVEDKFWYNPVMMTKMFDLSDTQSRNEFIIDGGFNGKEIFIEVELRRKNSYIYNNSFSREYESDSIDF